MEMEKLAKYAKLYDIDVSTEMISKFQKYADILLEWNEKMNLTRITEPDEIIVKHFLDSILLLRYIDLPENAGVIDVGTGAGFPGIPLKIVRPDISLVLLDSLRKRVGFLEHVSEQLDMDNRCIHGRAEEAGRKTELREKFHVATARAVASLPVLSEYCLPFVEVGGIFAAFKGVEISDEVDSSRAAVAKLGGKIEKREKYDLPMDNSRAIVVVRKISQTSTQYPRTSAKMAKTPL